MVTAAEKEVDKGKSIPNVTNDPFNPGGPSHIMGDEKTWRKQRM